MKKRKTGEKKRGTGDVKLSKDNKVCSGERPTTQKSSEKAKLNYKLSILIQNQFYTIRSSF